MHIPGDIGSAASSHHAPSRGLLLIVEDNRKTSDLLALYLEREGFKTLLAADGQQALDLARQFSPELIILDLMLPTLDGWDVCRELRQFSDVPILILSANGEEHHRVLGLTLGADDYMVKPFSPAELVARVRAILRRATPRSRNATQCLSHKGLILDPGKRKVTLNGKDILLTPLEYRLLQALMASPGRIFLRMELLNYLYPDGEVVVDRVVDVHIGNLRQKIEQNPSKPEYLLTARGMGYHFAEERG